MQRGRGRRGQAPASGSVPRLRGRALQAERKAWFARKPLCAECERHGRLRAAVELDHIVALDNGGTDDPSNKQGLCAPCHKAKTAIDMGYKPKERIGADGFPIDD